MSAVKETLIFCDGGKLGVKDCPMTGPYADGDCRTETATAQRLKYDVDGWVAGGNGVDVCPHCAKKLGFKVPVRRTDRGSA
jgi:hypothetical protein